MWPLVSPCQDSSNKMFFAAAGDLHIRAGHLIYTHSWWMANKHLLGWNASYWKIGQMSQEYIFPACIQKSCVTDWDVGTHTYIRWDKSHHLYTDWFSEQDISSTVPFLKLCLRFVFNIGCHPSQDVNHNHKLLIRKLCFFAVLF